MYIIYTLFKPHRVGRAREVPQAEGVHHDKAALAVGARRHERAELGAHHDGAVGEEGDAHLCVWVSRLVGGGRWCVPFGVTRHVGGVEPNKAQPSPASTYVHTYTHEHTRTRWSLPSGLMYDGRARRPAG